MRINGLLIFSWCSLILLGCATARLTPEQAAMRAISPTMAASNPAQYQGQRVEWGGLLIATHNRQTHTILEVLAYPLRNDGQPDLDRQPMGRFLAFKEGYLEPLEFTTGKLMTVTGSITGTRRGKVGEGNYLYPALDAHQLHLWPRPPPSRNPRLHFGIGVGSGGGGFGAGIGF